jgi:hypothetical protein
MRRHINGSRRLSAFLFAVLALVAGAAGTAVAGPDASSSAISKKKVKKIATKQINKLAPGLSVAHAESADTATNAENADNAASANSALSAQSALSARTADLEACRSSPFGSRCPRARPRRQWLRSAAAS